MKRVLNFFSRPEEEPHQKSTTYVAREPTLNPVPRASQQNTKPALKPQDNPRPMPQSRENTNPIEQVPTDYKSIVEFFQKKVIERKSPYNTLLKTADRLKEFIPDETSRLKAVLALNAEQWPPDVLSLAISTHIADIELARTKAKGTTSSIAGEKTLALRSQLNQLKEKNSKIADEIHALNENIAKLEATLNGNKATIASLTEQIQIAEIDANSVSFVDQAAENLKNDLLAKKIILGLP